MPDLQPYAGETDEEFARRMRAAERARTTRNVQHTPPDERWVPLHTGGKPQLDPGFAGGRKAGLLRATPGTAAAVAVGYNRTPSVDLVDARLDYTRLLADLTALRANIATLVDAKKVVAIAPMGRAKDAYWRARLANREQEAANLDRVARENEYARWLRALTENDESGLRSERDELRALLETR